MSTYNIYTYKSLTELDLDEYQLFFKQVGASVFYHPQFLLAAEKSPLLSTIATYYILVKNQKEQLLAFVPVYLQTSIDPFNVLETASSYRIEGDARALLTHIMHCSCSEYLMLNPSKKLMRTIDDQMRLLSREVGADFYGILNFNKASMHDLVDTIDCQCHFMWNKYQRDISTCISLADFYADTPRNGRKQYKKNLRRFEANAQSSIQVEAGRAMSIDDLREIATLCHNTSDKYGTGHYYPIDKLTEFMAHCLDLITFISVYVNNVRVSCNICFVHHDTLYLWACGMTYDDVDFSPYVVTVWKAYEYARQQGLKKIDIGRTSQAMKERMGFSPVPLYFYLNKLQS